MMGDLRDGDGSVLVQITNTPEIVGCELRMLCTMEIRASRFVRIVDYWDSMSFDDGMFAAKRNGGDRPADYLESQVGTIAASRLVGIATSLQATMSAGDSHAAADLFDDDAGVEDHALKVQVIGKAAVGPVPRSTAAERALRVGIAFAMSSAANWAAVSSGSVHRPPTSRAA